MLDVPQKFISHFRRSARKEEHVASKLLLIQAPLSRGGVFSNILQDIVLGGKVVHVAGRLVNPLQLGARRRGVCEYMMLGVTKA